MMMHKGARGTTGPLRRQAGDVSLLSSLIQNVLLVLQRYQREQAAPQLCTKMREAVLNATGLNTSPKSWQKWGGWRHMFVSAVRFLIWGDLLHIITCFPFLQDFVGSVFTIVVQLQLQLHELEIDLPSRRSKLCKHVTSRHHESALLTGECRRDSLTSALPATVIISCLPQDRAQRRRRLRALSKGRKAHASAMTTAAALLFHAQSCEAQQRQEMKRRQSSFVLWGAFQRQLDYSCEEDGQSAAGQLDNTIC